MARYNKCLLAKPLIKNSKLEIKKLSVPLNQSSTRTPINFLRNVQVGQQFQATVLRQLPEQNFVLLNLQGSLARAHSPLKLSSGQVLNLEVVKLGNLPQLKIVNRSESEDVLVRNVRQFLPKQESLASLLDKILTVTQSSSKLSTLPSSFRPIVYSFLEGFPQLRDIIRPEGMKKAFRNSGLFLESKLANSNTGADLHASNDIKAQLLRLLAQLKATIAQYPFRSNPAPSDSSAAVGVTLAGPLNLGRKSPVTGNQKSSREIPVEMANLKALLNHQEGALAKIMLDQIASLPRDEFGKQIWQLELPFLNGQSAQSAKLKIVRDEGNRTSKYQQSWTVVLELNPSGSEVINCKIKLSGKQVDTYFSSSSEQTSNLIKDNLTRLKQRFHKAGLQTGYLESKFGEMPNESPINVIERLLDEKA